MKRLNSKLRHPVATTVCNLVNLVIRSIAGNRQVVLGETPLTGEFYHQQVSRIHHSLYELL